jgi:hypothetical protein
MIGIRTKDVTEMKVSLATVTMKMTAIAKLTRNISTGMTESRLRFIPTETMHTTIRMMGRFELFINLTFSLPSSLWLHVSEAIS